LSIFHNISIIFCGRAHEYIIEGLARLQLGYDKGAVHTGILMLTAKRSEKSPYGDIKSMVKEDVESLWPTVSMPISICLFDLGEPYLPE
jgi:hypothetical protein